MELAVTISAKKRKGDNCQMYQINNVKTQKKCFSLENGEFFTEEAAFENYLQEP